MRRKVKPKSWVCKRKEKKKISKKKKKKKQGSNEIIQHFRTLMLMQRTQIYFQTLTGTYNASFKRSIILFWHLQVTCTLCTPSLSPSLSLYTFSQNLQIIVLIIEAVVAREMHHFWSFFIQIIDIKWAYKIMYYGNLIIMKRVFFKMSCFFLNDVPSVYTSLISGNEAELYSFCIFCCLCWL